MSIELMSFEGSAPVPRSMRNTKYEVYVYRTRTGEVVRRMPIVGTPRWESGLNLVGSWSVQVPIDFRYISREELRQLSEPWYWSWAVALGNRIMQAGPVTGQLYTDGDTSVTIVGAGLMSLYKNRILANASRASNSDVTKTDADYAFGTGDGVTPGQSARGAPIPVSRQNLSLHTILKRLLENEQAKPGGSVQLVLPADIAGTASREYLGGELALTANRIFELSQVIDGPEYELWPEFTNTERNSIRHVVRIGNPRIGNTGYPHAWSYRKALTSLGMESSGDSMTSRRWDRGAGFDRNLKYGFSEDLDGVTSGPFQQRPLTESVGLMHSEVDSVDTLNNYATADRVAGQAPMLTLTAEVSTEGDAGDGKDPPSPTIDTILNGDTGVFHVYGHPVLKDGPYHIRILKMGPGSDVKRARLTVDVLSQP